MTAKAPPPADLVVDTAARTLTAAGVTTACVIGRGGPCAAEQKREGDGCTPLGRFSLRAMLLRPDRVGTVTSGLPRRWLRPSDGWSDDPVDPAYNRAVTHPHGFSAEALWRADGVYDVIVPIGFNDAPVVPGRGSAIFLHCTRPDAAPTEGCIAIPKEALLAILAALTGTSTMLIS